ncbi:hypothetical protein ABIA35_008923 [Catenulispora sp. MAP12-49]|uniref:hypothetical protein n=1 Tax=unclassified Catenulispora TaxID=414885 RepID=UPI003516A28C
MTRVWATKTDAERIRWVFDPCVGVGPLVFGMNPGEISSKLDGFPGSFLRRDGVIHYGYFHSLGVTVYFKSERLFCVAIDARTGPQVLYGQVALVGRVPSELEGEFIAQASSDGIDDFCATGMSDIGSDELGVLLGVQRSGDILLSRPIFLSREYSKSICDEQVSSIPAEEW